MHETVADRTDVHRFSRGFRRELVDEVVPSSFIDLFGRPAKHDGIVIDDLDACERREFFLQLMADDIFEKR